MDKKDKNDKKPYNEKMVNFAMGLIGMAKDVELRNKENMFKEAAENMFLLFNCFIASGFDEEQAMALMIGLFKPTQPNENE